MNSRLILILSFVLALGGAALGQEDNPLPPSNAKIYVEEMEFDFGYLPNDAFVGHAYKVFSRGQDSLKILRVKPACGCTKAPLRKEVIAPGDSGEVELIFHAAKGQRGRADKSAAVTCNDNAQQNINLRFRGNIYPTEFPDSLTPVTLSQSKVTWMYGKPMADNIITVTNVSSAPIRLQPIALPSGYADVDIPKDEIKPGKTRDIKIKMAKTFSGTDYQKSFTFECSDAAKTRFTVPVMLDAPVSVAAPALQPAATPKTEGSH